MLAGRLVGEMEAAHARILQVTRDKKTPPGVRVDGAKACFDMLDRMLQRMQSMGFLPSATQKISADLNHTGGDLRALADLEAELRRVREIAGQADDSDTGSDGSQADRQDVA
ncbi:MAG: hypothetical protein NCW75_03940 [Phycisphaera sp.]|nr:MAG: hypothetical protein NCW75_03940 [Phycisphaera sp.]